MKARVTSPLTADNVNAVMAANERGSVVASSIRDERATAGVFTVPHDFGSVPLDFMYSRIDNLDVYATRANRANWTATQAELTGSAAGDFRIWFIGRIGD